MGIKNPYNSRQTYDGLGVENGSEAILTADFLTKIQPHYLSEYVFPKPEQVDVRKFDKILCKQINGLKKFINNQIRANQTQIVVGGDHFITLPSVLAVRDRIGSFKNLGYVQFDSHGDMNSKALSPTGNFHGMYVRPLVDCFDSKEIDDLVPEKLPFKNIIYIGNLKLDPAERSLFENKKINIIGREALLKNKNRVIKIFNDFVSSFKYLHVTFDIDVMDKTQAPATGLPALKGLMFEDIAEMLGIIRKHPNLSLDLAELNPRKAGLNKTIKTVHKILLSVLL